MANGDAGWRRRPNRRDTHVAGGSGVGPAGGVGSQPVAITDVSTRIQELEEEQATYPEARAEILTDLASACHAAGDHERAERILRELIAEQPDDGGLARAELAGLYFDLGRREEAYTELAELRARCRSLDPPHLAPELAADVLEEHGDLTGALEWLDLAVSLMHPDQLAAARAEQGWLSTAGPLIRARRRIRAGLGLPADDLDRSMPSEQEILANPFPARLRNALARRSAPQTMRVLYWPRTELAAATARWPTLLDPERSDPAVYSAELQRKWTHAAEEHGIARVQLVPASADSMAEYVQRTGADVQDEETRLDYMAERNAAGHVVSWPPPRNAPCWCGSQNKYKKCCGRPGRQQE